jgi:cytochrome P450
VTEKRTDLPAFDYYDPEYCRDPYPKLTELRDQCPVARGENYGGYWALTSHDVIEEALHATDVFSSRHNSIPVPDEASQWGGTPIPPLQYDPPQHDRVKKLLSTAFVPKRVMVYEPEIRAYAVKTLQELRAKGTFDASRDFARMIPTFTLCRLLGVRDDANADQFTEWVERFLDQMMSNPEDAMVAFDELYQFVEGLVKEREASLGEDVISHFLEAEVDGERLTRNEVTLAAHLLIMAGIDTTWSMIASSILYLATHPEEQERLRNEPDLVESAREEFLRIFAPVTVGRIVAKDVVWHGAEMHAGEPVALAIPAANRDPKAFDRADEVVLDRHPNRHLAFGYGIHRCLGINTARLELKVALEEIVRQWPSFHVKEGEEIDWVLGPIRRARSLIITVDE